RSMSISVGRLFGVDVRLHFTFLLLPLFIYGMEYTATKGHANGPRDLALVGIILGCVGAHEVGRMLAAHRYGLIPKAVILLPLTGVTIFDDSHAAKPQPASLLWQREVRLALIGPLVNLGLAFLIAAALISIDRNIVLLKWPLLQAANLRRS